LEVFSDRPYAFSDAHITLLKQLAQIAVTGRTQSAPKMSPPFLKASIDTEAAEAPHAAPGTATPRFRLPNFDAASKLTFLSQKMKGEEGRPWRLGAAGLLLVVLAALAWTLSRGRANTASPTQSVQAVTPAASSVTPAPSETTLNLVPSGAAPVRSARSKPAPDVVAGNVVERASKSIVIERSPTPSAERTAASNGSSPRNEPTEEAQAPDSTVLSAGLQGSTSGIPESLVATQPSLPSMSLRTSEGVTGGTLRHRVSPVYPSQARLQRVEGPVTLDAVVGEDGNVHDVKVLSGNPILAIAAKQAVQQWRYDPFQLNGKPVPIHTRVTIQFKLP
jgi:protein TonB